MAPALMAFFSFFFFRIFFIAASTCLLRVERHNLGLFYDFSLTPHTHTHTRVRVRRTE